MYIPMSIISTDIGSMEADRMFVSNLHIPILRPGEKLYVSSSRLERCTNTLMRPLNRIWFTGYSRDATVCFIQNNIIDPLCKVIKRCHDRLNNVYVIKNRLVYGVTHESTWLYQRFCHQLLEKVSLLFVTVNSLMVTYEDDSLTVEKLRKIQSEIILAKMNLMKLVVSNNNKCNTL